MVGERDGEGGRVGGRDGGETREEGYKEGCVPDTNTCQNTEKRAGEKKQRPHFSLTDISHHFLSLSVSLSLSPSRVTAPT